MMRNQFLRATVFLGLASSLTIGLSAHRNGTRYFPFLEKPEEVVVKKHSHLAPEFFYLKVSTANKRGGGNFGVPELWGMYDLNDVLKSLEAVQPGTTAQLRHQLPATLQNNKPIPYRMNESFNVEGLAFGYEQAFSKKLSGFSIGIWLPVMYAAGLGAFNPNVDNNGNIGGVQLVDSNGNPTTDGLKVDQVRRETHDQLGFVGNHWDGSGLGDLDVHARWNYFVDHQLLVRSIDSYIQVGCIVPIGMNLKTNEPLSVPSMSDGHWGANFDVVSEIELKQDWKLGFMLGGLYQFKETRNRRLPVCTEPVVYSALTGKVGVQPGFTFKFSPYFTLENLTDGVHFQIRYTYLHHNMDKWYDRRSQTDQTDIPSYLTPNNPLLTAAQMAQNIRDREVLTKWTSHFFSFQLMYDPKQALQNWGMDPLIYVTYDLPVSGSSIAKTHQLSLGVQLHF